MKDFRPIWRLLNSPFIMAFIIFGLTTILGTLYQERHLQDQKKIEKDFQLRSHKLKQGQKSLNEITDCIMDRYQQSRKMVGKITENRPQATVTEYWNKYMESVDDWNQKLLLNRIKINAYVGNNPAQGLLTYGIYRKETLFYNEIKKKLIILANSYCNEIENKYIIQDFPYYNSMINTLNTLQWPNYNEIAKKENTLSLLYYDKDNHKDNLHELRHYNEIKNKLIIREWPYCNKIKNKLITLLFLNYNEIKSEDSIQEWLYNNEIEKKYFTLRWPDYDKKMNTDAVPDLLHCRYPCLHSRFYSFHKKLRELKNLHAIMSKLKEKEKLDAKEKEKLKAKVKEFREQRVVVIKLRDELNDYIHGYLNELSLALIEDESELRSHSLPAKSSDSVQSKTNTTNEIKTSKLF